MPVKKQHFFVINQLGQSAHRKGAFESAEAARAWAAVNYKDYPAWIIAAEPVNPAHRALNAAGEPQEV